MSHEQSQARETLHDRIKLSTTASSPYSVLVSAASAILQSDPFPHLVIDNALEPALYERLTTHFPDIEAINRTNRPLKSNHPYMLSATEVLSGEGFSPDWKSFFEYHVSQSFWREALSFIKPSLLKIHPELERQAGRPLEEFRINVRQREGGIAGEIALDCQFALNTPVTKASTVRTPHLDRPNKLFNAMLYCRIPEDDTPGGDLVFYRCLKRVVYSNGSAVMPTRIIAAKEIAYRSNRLVLFINSPWSVHGVSPRPITPHCRRYINILCEYREPLFFVPNHWSSVINPKRAWDALRRRSKAG
jgi:hypothetical protein